MKILITGTDGYIGARMAYLAPASTSCGTCNAIGHIDGELFWNAR